MRPIGCLLLALLASPSTAQEIVVLRGATVHDGTGRPPIEGATIVIENGRIARLTGGPVDPPGGARVVDLSGRHVAPALVDTHVHYSQTGWLDGRPDFVDLRAEHPYPAVVAGLRDDPRRIDRALLACGVTAVLDCGGFPWTRRLARSDGPVHVVAAGPLLATYAPPALQLPDQRQMVLLSDPDAAREAVRSHVALGSGPIKFWFIVVRRRLEADARLLAAVGDEARRLDRPLIVHATTLESARAAVAAGARLLVHSVEDQAVDDRFVEAALAAGTFYCPTLVVAEGYEAVRAGRRPADLDDRLAVIDPSLAAGPRAWRWTARGGGADASERSARRREVLAANLRRLHAAGVPVVLGTDAGNPLTFHGPSVFRELEAMAAAGLEPAAILTAATRDAARAIGRGDDLGLIAAGRRADLVVLAGDPSADVGAWRTIESVVTGGVLRSRASLLPGGE